MVGQTISHYKVLEKIGEGGMGEVYRAEDTNLSREVAIKVLPEQFTKDPQRLARFEREAKLLASLNHPNIAAIHSFEHADDIHFLVLELVPGETLAERVAKGPLPVEEALEVCRQIAEGVEAAHEKGVIHRDLKPANVKVTPEGKVKILDFGLAKAFEGETPVTDISQSPTLTEEMTRAGVILGTAAYMSPEQAKGKPVDKRADVFAFGAVLYELLTGKRAFEGETITETIAAVLKSEPEWGRLPSDTPWRIKELLEDCLQKDPHGRPHDISHARIQIKKALKEPTTASPIGQTLAGQPGRWGRTITFGLVALVGAVIGVAIWSLLGSGGTVQPRASRVTISVPEGYEMGNAQRPLLTLSPDGRTLAYYTDGRLHVRSLDRFDAVPLVGTEGARDVFFSPDGDWIAFSSPGTVGLKKVAVGGGPILTIAEVTPQSADWGASGEIVYASALGSSGLSLMSEEGDASRQITTVLDSELETAHLWPQLLPDGKSVLFTVIGPSGGWEDASIVVQDIASGERRTVVEKGTYGRYISTGHIIYAQANGTILAVPFDLARRQTNGTASSVASGVRVALWGGAASFAVSDGGTFAFVRGTSETQFLLNWMDREGKVIRQLGPPLNGSWLSVSPDGSRIALTIRLPDHNDIWIVDAATGQRDRFTFESTEDETPMWSPDGKRIAYSSAWTGEARRVYVKSVDGSSDPELLYTGEYHLHLTSWSPDGKWLAFYQFHPDTKADIWLVSADGEEQLVPVATTAATERDAVFSPDGQWLAYNSDETGQREVYAVSFPELGAKRQISQKGGWFARWDAQGNELFYRGLNGEVMVVTMTAQERSLRSGTPRVLFPFSYSSLPDYGVAPDGQYFAILASNPDAPAREINIVLNWFEELKRLVPTP